MMMKKFFMGIAAVAAAIMPAEAVEWMTDYEAALQRAEQEKKAVLVDFTGSDWCHFCIVLRRRVLDTPAFEAYGQDKFVYLEVDLPHANKISAELRKQNNALVSKYRVGGFPTVLVLDAEGHALGGFTGGMTRLPDVLTALKAPLYVHGKLLEARHLQGAEKAAALADAYLHYPDNYRSHNAWLREELQQLDPTGASGWQATYAAEQQMAAMEQELNACVTDRERMMQTYERYLAQALPGNRSRILGMKERYLNGIASIKLRSARTVEDVLEVKALQIQAAECCENPEQRAEILRRIEEVYARPEELLPAHIRKPR